MEAARRLTRALAIYLALLGSFTLASSCGSGRAVGASDERSLQERYNSLAQAVRNLPNVQVSGETVIYRGTSSLSTESTEMQFLVDDVLIGSMAQAEALFPLNSIRAIRIVPPTDAISRYGARASSGLIELILLN